MIPEASIQPIIGALGYTCGICKKIFYADPNKDAMVICPYCKGNNSLPNVKEASIMPHNDSGRIGLNKKPSSSLSSIGKGLLFGIIILGIIIAIVVFNQSSTHIEDFKNDLHSSTDQTEEKIKNQVVDSFISNPYDNIQILNEISREVDENENLKLLNLSGDTKTKIKKILSDPNPDPENKNGTGCGTVIKRCKYCSREFDAPAEFKTIQVTVRFFMSPIVRIVLAYDHAVNYNQIVTQLCTDFGNGTKYCCDNWTGVEFCSLRCKDEYSMRHQ